MPAEESALVRRLTELLEPVVLDYGLELVELQFRREEPGWVLRLIIDGDDGVGIDDCSKISREVSHLLEVEDPIAQAFQLEVSSPGLDRPLKRERDFTRSRGKLAKIVCREEIDGQKVFSGRLGELTAGVISLEIAADAAAGPASGDDPAPRVVRIPLTAISRAKLVIEW